MPVSKTHLFSESEKSIAIIGRALAHPARIKIVQLIKENGYVRNCDLVIQLELSCTSVSNHIRKLVDANLIEIQYEPNYFEISIKQNSDHVQNLWSII